MGFGNIVMCDINGIICEGDEGSTPDRRRSPTSPTGNTSTAPWPTPCGGRTLRGRVRPNLVTAEMVSTMKDGIVFAMANPTPEIMPDEPRQAACG